MWGCRKNPKLLTQYKFPLLRTPKSLITSPRIQNSVHLTSSKHTNLRQNTQNTLEHYFLPTVYWLTVDSGFIQRKKMGMNEYMQVDTYSSTVTARQLFWIDYVGICCKATIEFGRCKAPSHPLLATYTVWAFWKWFDAIDIKMLNKKY